MTVAIVFETHSITEDNERGVATGWLPGRLSERGRALAVELGRRRPAAGFAVVYASDLARAVETARLAYGGTTVPIRLDSRLRECDYGAANGMPVAALAAQRAGRIDVPFPCGESYRDVVRRTARFLADLAAEWDGRRVLLIGHSATRWSLDHLLHGVPLADLVDAPFDWREGWEYPLPGGYGT